MLVRKQWWLGLVCMWAVCLPQLAGAEDTAAELAVKHREQSELRDRIAAMQKEIDAREASRKEAADALKASETAISIASRKLVDLVAQQKKAQGELDDIRLQIVRQQALLEQRQQELANQLRKQYQSGLSPLSAWLSGNDPQELGRNLGYLDYVAKARSEAVTDLQRQIDRLAALQAQADVKQRELAKLVLDANEQKVVLEKEKKERATVLAQIEGQIAAQRAEAARLERDEKHLGELITGLDEQIIAARRLAEANRREQEFKKAEAAKKAAEAKRLEELERQQLAKQAAQAAREAAQAAKLAQASDQAEANAVAEQAARDAREAREIATQAAKQAKEAEAARKAAEAANAQALAPVAGTGLKPGLRWPVRGNVMARFGTDRPEGGIWRGMLIAAPEGSPVQVVAGGTVVYATWLRGFGNIMIVEHGQQYLSIYAYAQSLLKQVGDAVVAGDTIATVGNTGGQLDSALYFEIRHRNVAVDPAPFLVK